MTNNQFWDVNAEWDKRSELRGYPKKQTIYAFVGSFNGHDVWADEKHKELRDPTVVVVGSNDLDDYDAGFLSAFTWCEEKGLPQSPGTQAVTLAAKQIGLCKKASCKGECGRQECHDDYQDFLSGE